MKREVKLVFYVSRWKPAFHSLPIWTATHILAVDSPCPTTDTISNPVVENGPSFSHLARCGAGPDWHVARLSNGLPGRCSSYRHRAPAEPDRLSPAPLPSHHEYTTTAPNGWTTSTQGAQATSYSRVATVAPFRHDQHVKLLADRRFRGYQKRRGRCDSVQSRLPLPHVPQTNRAMSAKRNKGRKGKTTSAKPAAAWTRQGPGRPHQEKRTSAVEKYKIEIEIGKEKTTQVHSLHPMARIRLVSLFEVSLGKNTYTCHKRGDKRAR
jgi:hypothetical protein